MNDPKKPKPSPVLDKGTGIFAGTPEELPIVTSVGIVRLPKGGWAAVYLETQGIKVVKAEVLSGPEARAIVAEKAKIEFVTKILVPKPKVGA